MRYLSVSLGAFVITALSIGGAACSTFSAEEPQVVSVADAGSDLTEERDAATSETSTPTDVMVLASGHVDLRAVVASETNAYFVSRAPGIIYQVRLDGTGGVQEFYKASPIGSPSIAALHDFTVYAADFGKAMLARREEGGGSATTKATSGALNPAAIAVGTSPAGVRVVVLAVSGNTGTVQQYTTELDLALTSSGAYKTPFDVAVTGTDIWWTESAEGKIWQGHLNESQVDARVGDESGCESIAADAQGVYWTRPTDGLVRMMVPPQNTVATIAVNQISPVSIASDASGVYWLTGDGKLQRSNRQVAELPPQTLAKGFATGQRLRAITLTSRYVVWITADGKVLRKDK